MKRSLRRLAAAFLALCLLLGLTACSGKTSGKIPGGSGAVTETALPEKNDQESKEPLNEAAQVSLDFLRECMNGTNQAAAVAYLGYLDKSERGGDLTDWLWTSVPGLMEKLAFLQYIPAECVLGGDYGDLYCIVPRDENTSLAVNHVVWRSNGRGVWPEADDVLYRSEYAEPLLIFVRWDEYRDEPNVEVVAMQNGGTEVKWYPVMSAEDGGYIVIPEGENYEPMLLDFSRFGDAGGMDIGGEWLAPTDLGLLNSTWSCNGWLLKLLDGGDPDYSGVAELYYQPGDGQEFRLAYSGAWRMEYDCLRLELSAGVGTSASGSFPVLIDLSGEHLYIRQDMNTHACPPFFDDGATAMTLTLNYG